MQVKIVDSGKTKINVRLPLAFLKSRLFYAIIRRGAKGTSKCSTQQSGQRLEQASESDEKVVTADKCDNLPQAQSPDGGLIKQNNSSANSITHKHFVEIYKVLRKCVKVSGHFALVDIETKDNTKIYICV